jgi:hypothetical protein
MEDIINRKVVAFHFKNGPGMADDMVKKSKNREIGVIERVSGTHYSVRFPDGRAWHYPYPEILQHMLPKEEEVDLNKLFKDLIKVIKIVKL